MMGFHRPTPIAQGVAATESGRLVFWDMLSRTRFAFWETNELTIVESVEQIRIASPIWTEPSGHIRIPEVKSVKLIAADPYYSLLIRRGQFIDIDSTIERVKSFLSKHKATYFVSYEASYDARSAYMRRRMGLLVGDSVTGALLTTSGEVYFWELFMGNHVLLQDSDGRLCWLEPAESATAP